MKKLAFAGALLAALATAGIAVAHGGDDAQSVKRVAATFNAATVGSSQTRTCTTAAGKTIATTTATYTGTAAGDPDLSGNLTFTAHATINTTDGIGVLSGRLKIAASGGNTDAQFTGVYDGGNIAGTISGHAATSHTRLLGNLSSGFSTTGGLTGGKIGGPAAGGSAVELVAGGCRPSQSHPSTTSARGTVTAVSATSITVNGLTCNVTNANLVKSISVNAFVTITCSFSGGVNTLTKVEGKDH
jgi:hypothetical protein